MVCPRGQASDLPFIAPLVFLFSFPHLWRCEQHRKTQLQKKIITFISPETAEYQNYITWKIKISIERGACDTKEMLLERAYLKTGMVFSLQKATRSIFSKEGEKSKCWSDLSVNPGAEQSGDQGCLPGRTKQTWVHVVLQFIRSERDRGPFKINFVFSTANLPQNKESFLLLPTPRHDFSPFCKGMWKGGSTPASLRLFSDSSL